MARGARDPARAGEAPHAAADAVTAGGDGRHAVGAPAAGRPSEELLLRARLDLDHGRPVEAALVTRAATEALAAEGHGGGDAAAANSLAQAALTGELSPDQTEELADLLASLERFARRRRYAEES